MSNTEMKEYKGMECIIEDCGWKTNGYVVNVDREIGITIHDEEDNPIYCINKEEIFDYSLKSRKDRNRIYHEAFTRCIEMIKEGVLTNINFGSDFERGFEVSENGNFVFADMLSCPFK